MSVKSAARSVARRVLPIGVRKALRSARIHSAARKRSGDLIALATLFGTDPWGVRAYAPHYQRHFRHLRDRKLTVLEIGVGGYGAPDEGGESLRTWKWFFPRAEIVGIDLYDKRALEEERIRLFQGSQDDPRFLTEVIAEIGRPDIIIDDGSHLNGHVLASFVHLFPLLKDDGIYVIEDTQTAYWPTWGGDTIDRNSMQTSMGFAKSLIDGLNHAEFLLPGYSPTYYDQHIVGLHFYHNLVFIDKGSNDEASNMVTGGVLRTS